MPRTRADASTPTRLRIPTALAVVVLGGVASTFAGCVSHDAPAPDARTADASRGRDAVAHTADAGKVDAGATPDGAAPHDASPPVDAGVADVPMG